MGCVVTYSKSVDFQEQDPFLMHECWDFPMGTVVSSAAGGMHPLIDPDATEDDYPEELITTTITENDATGLILERVFVHRDKTTSEALIEIPKPQPRSLGKENVNVSSVMYETTVHQNSLGSITRTTWDMMGHPLPLRVRMETDPTKKSRADRKNKDGADVGRTVDLIASSLEPVEEQIHGKTVHVFPYKYKFNNTGAGFVKLVLSGKQDLAKREVTLSVSVKEARDLIVADADGKSDPYCVVQVGKNTQRTQVQYGTLNPVWNEKFTFILGYDSGTPDIRIRIYDKDITSADDNLGFATLSLRGMKFDNTKQEHWVALTVNETESNRPESVYWLSPELPGWGGILLPKGISVKNVYMYSKDPEWLPQQREEFGHVPYSFISTIKRMQKKFVKLYATHTEEEDEAAEDLVSVQDDGPIPGQVR